MTGGTRRAAPALVLLGLAAAAYAVAAWQVAPGFYDGIAPQQPYRWVSPPPQFASSNQPPLSASHQVKVGANGVVDPGFAQTGDGQASLSFVPGAFKTPAGRWPVTIDIKPVSSFPDPGDVHLATNVYCVTTSSPLADGKDVLVTLRYSDQLPAPDAIYEYEGSAPWRKLGSTGSAAPFTIAVRSTALGCYGAGYPAQARQQAKGAKVGGGQTLPIVVAVAIVVVVLAGIPLAVMRRRGEPPAGGGPGRRPPPPGDGGRGQGSGGSRPQGQRRGGRRPRRGR